jgi:concanavalin A-like lectin/glucanase superfamily protein
MAAVDPGRALLALVVACLGSGCTSDHHFIDPDIFYGRDAGGANAGSGGTGAAPPEAGLDAGGVAMDAAPPEPPEAGTAPSGDGGCPDADVDGVCDDDDRCPGVADQDDGADIDGDGVPDACDPCGAAVALALGPLFYFAFDEAAGSSSAHNAGSANPSASYIGGATSSAQGVTGPERPALHLPGAGNTAYPRVMVQGVSAFPSEALALSVWIRTSQTSDFSLLSYSVSAEPDHFLIYFIANGSLRIGVENVVYGNTGNVTSALADGGWHHVVISGSVASELSYYVDTELVATVTTPQGSALQPGGVLIVGQDQDTVNGGFSAVQALDGDLDELALYDHELSEAQIQAIFAATTCQ